MRKRMFLMFMITVFFVGLIITEAKGARMAIKNGSKVKFDYTLTVDNKIVDTSKGKVPLEYVQGSGQIIPGLARQMEGMKTGEERIITVKSEEAYGERTAEAMREVPKASFPKDMKIAVGMPLQVQDDQGRVAVVQVADIKKDSIVIDFNHPLAGKTLTFDIKIVSIE